MIKPDIYVLMWRISYDQDMVFANRLPDVAVAPGPRPPRVERVCLVIGQLGLGGAEKQLALLAAGLRRRGVETTVVVLRQGGPREAILRDAGVPLINLGLPSPASSWQRFAVFALALERLRRILRRLRPDVVHAFLLHSCVLTAPAARLARVPVCVAGRRSLSHYKAGLRFAVAGERVATRMTDLLIANAHAVADDVVRTEGVGRDRIRVVYNGLADPAFEPVPAAALASAVPVILCVANLRAYKGHRYLLDAAARLQERGLPCTLALVGEGAEREGLQHQAEMLGLDVRFLGARTDIAALLARADVAVLPSLTEGMSNAVMEAMAAGRPVVATDVGGTAELIEGRGVLVPPADADALAAGLERVLRDPAGARTLAEAALAWSRRFLHLDGMVDRHLAIYSELLEARCAE
jgi:glycosyltransferase involved in cell wall biosynthesis